MDDWLFAGADGRAAALPEQAVLVTVAHAEGSVPREAGAHLLVGAAAQWGTIGGGHLELRAIERARAMLAEGALAARLERYPLGPGLGQCCGGVVHLAFERVERDELAALAAQVAGRGQDGWRLAALDGSPAAALFDAGGGLLHCGRHAAHARAEHAAAGGAWCGAAAATADAGRAAGAASAAASVPAPIMQHTPQHPPQQGVFPAFDRAGGTHVLRDAAGRRWLADRVAAPHRHVLLFGAGHVGAALVRVLGALPCRVTWVDERADLFPSALPHNVTVEATDTPEAVAAQAAPGAWFLVMTHSHALDQRLAETILQRPGQDWFGLIGSSTKRAQFERRLRERGISQARLDAMACPIGVPGIAGKQPGVIAVAVAAQLLLAWEAIPQLERN
ncbi:xanthine dehydrogenase accessory protein XdhC [Massilia forsythiae]|uniref:Xanthine dehydrogenase accessory protein XdhC n=1 Tax=Massilia forsythiae TaxID=2728020 RepID=A0A7Z2VTJ6_9BURK|nr:xanthine dehydrogenase accessory protein XdhC [Massilia forsythiae]QJD99182.1 xanthine dehydrogenase accessory protein XdhC [Massilia forsythiae]